MYEIFWNSDRVSGEYRTLDEAIVRAKLLKTENPAVDFNIRKIEWVWGTKTLAERWA
jgi:hypothetical protein